MSKNLTRKGLAFGALVALGSSVFAGSPAMAAGEITLAPTTGKNFNSIIGAGISLTGTLDALFTGTAAGDTMDAAAFIVKNPAGAKLYINTAEAFSYSLPDADGFYTKATADTNWSGTAATNTALPYADYTAYNSSTNEIVTNATSIVIWAPTVAVGDDDVSQALSIDSTGTSDVSLTVQAFADTSYSAGTATAGAIDGFERSSAVQAVKLYAPNNVVATTSITTLAAATGSATSTTAKVVVKTVYSGSVNHAQVASKTKQNLYVGSVKKTLSAAASSFSTSDLARDLAVTAAAADTSVSSTYYNVTTGSSVATTDTTALSTAPTALANFALGKYTAQTYFNGTAIGALSPVVDLAAGLNSTVAAVDVTTVDGANVDFTTAGAAQTTQTVKVRPSTKSVTLTAQAQTSANANVEASNSEFKAVVTATKLDASSAASVTGGATGLAATGDSVTVYARSGSTGAADFVLNNTVGKAGDILTAVISVKDTNGVWVDATTVTLTWETAALSALTPKPGLYVSGSTVNIDFLAKDQYGEAISSTTDGALSVYAVATLAGVESKTTFEKTVSVVNGKASFSFANYATAGASAGLKAKLYAGVTELSSYQKTVTVYNALATEKIAVADSFETAISYKDFVTGDTSSAATAAAVAKAGLVKTVDITGTVLNTTSAAQPGAAVEISAAGLLFLADGVWTKDKTTVYADEYGNFTVGVVAHTVNPKGIVVSLTSGGKTATTKLKTYLPTSLAAANLKFALSVPALLVKNTTYAVVATLTDKWGNPVNANDTDETVGGTDFAVSFVGTGSVEINSSSTTLYKDFGKDGKVTVFVRSVKDIAGPGSINATLGSAFEYATTIDSTNTTAAAMVASIATDDTATAWDESAWSNSLTTDVDIFEKKPTASISKTATSSAVVKNASGATVKIVRGTKSTTKVATSNSYKLSVKGGTGTVKVYVNGVKVASK